MLSPNTHVYGQQGACRCLTVLCHRQVQYWLRIKAWFYIISFGYIDFEHVLVDTLHWRHNERDGVSNHRRLDGLLNRLFRRRSKKTSKLRVTGLCEGNSPVTGEFPSQMASNAENVSIWWRHYKPMLLKWSTRSCGTWVDIIPRIVNDMERPENICWCPRTIINETPKT